MTYRLGVDLGTTYTAAAVWSRGHVDLLPLGNRSLQMPSVLFVMPDGSMLVGEAAERRGLGDPSRIVREFKRRIGDPVPIIVGGAPYAPQTLVSRMLAWVVEQATQRQGGPPEHVTVTHPANWGPFKQDLLAQAIRLADLTDVSTLTEPAAAAIAYASRTPLAEGATVAVYDLGGGTFDAAVLRRTAGGFTLLGQPEGIEHLGGIDFDEAVFQHVVGALGGAIDELDLDDDAAVSALARLRRDCVEAKESLSADTETVVPVTLPGVSTTVRLTRGEFADMVRPAIDETVSAMDRALRSAEVAAADLAAIVLVGGSSRIPLVSEQLSAAFGRPIALDTHPKHDVATGAALPGGAVASAFPDPVAPTALGSSSSSAASTDFAASTSSSSPDGSTGADAETSPMAPVDVTMPFATLLPAGGAAGAGDATGTAVNSDLAGSAAPVATGVPAPGAGEATTRGGGRGRLIAAAAAVVVLVAVTGTVAALTRGSDDTVAVAPSTSARPSGTATPTTAAVDVPRSPTALAADLIVWPRARKGNWDIAVIGADGTGEKALTSNPAEDSFPVMSPDRRSVLYLQRTTGATSYSLRVIGADGSGDRALFAAPVPQCPISTRPAWSVTGLLAVPCQTVAGGPVSLLLMRFDGTVVRTLDSGVLGDPAFTRDGSAVVYWRNAGAAGDGGSLFQTPVDGRSPRRQLTFGSAGEDNDPATSPVADAVAFRRRGTGGMTIWTVDSSPGTRKPPKQVTTGDAGDQDPSWSPDGTRLAFKRGPARKADLWVVGADGTGARRVVDNPEGDTAPAWSGR